MRRILRILALLLALAAIVIGAEWTRERFSGRASDLRAFDAAAVGRLDTDMWRSYYERRPVRLFEQMITLLRTQFGMRPLEATTNAYRAAHAAFVFKDGRSRTDYEKALPDLEAYYADIAALSARPFDSHRAAALELEWWIVHRENPPGLPDALAALQAEIYGIPAERFAVHARLRAQAMDLRDGKGAAITETDWQRIGEMLAASWNSLYRAVQTPH
ncbi:MAG: hypothetical protein LAP61_20865 [Acidobacteriia bacterium]|nr:hypothetical protein [Terriglobia bacterium]